MKHSYAVITTLLLAFAFNAHASGPQSSCVTGQPHPDLRAVQSDEHVVVSETQDKAAPKLGLDYVNPALAQTVELSLLEAKKLLASTEGPAWRVFQVTAAACDPAGLKKVHQLTKAAVSPTECEPAAPARYRIREVPRTTECRQIKKECATASAFAEKFKLHATCSTLYTRTTVLLSTDSALKQPRKSLDAGL